ncbi:MAG: TVP38/TMEM64 family protein [Caldilineaceae bacterium]|nr:TVP38/TMEM64 family protein [Caldilineaceae bacterium]
MTVQSKTEAIKQRDSFWQGYGQRGMALILWLILIGAYIWYTRANNLNGMDAVRQLLDLFRSSMIGPLIYVAIYTVRPLIFFSSALLTLAAGFVFGPVWGIVYSMLGGNLSALFAYAIGYFFGEDILTEDTSEGILQGYVRRMRQNSFETVLIMRFLFLPFDAVSYLAGFLRIDWRSFALASLLGSIPGGVAIALAGASGHFDESGLSLDPRMLVVAVVLFVVSLILSRYMRRREQKTGG